MQFVLYIFLAILILLLMVVIHEFGHYIAGKILKFKINEFAVGFGPKLLSKKLKNGEVFSLRLIPLGGFCAFEGEENAENQDIKAFVNEKPWKRIIVFAAGGVANLISAVFFSFLFLLIVGYATPQVTKVAVDSSNISYNQLMEDDVFLKIDGKKVKYFTSFNDYIGNVKLGESIDVVVLRGGEEKTITITKKIISTGDDSYEGFGISTQNIYQRGSYFKAVGQAIPFTGHLSVTILKSFGQLITGKVSIKQVSGPIGTIGDMATMSQVAWQNIFLLLPLIAANLGIFNLLPIPALDGSKIVFTSIEWIRRKPINRNVEMWIHFIGFILLFGAIIILDILHFLL